MKGGSTKGTGERAATNRTTNPSHIIRKQTTKEGGESQCGNTTAPTGKESGDGQRVSQLSFIIFLTPDFEGLGVRLELFGGWENPKGFWGAHLGHWAWVR